MTSCLARLDLTFTGNSSSPASKLEWSSMDDFAWKLDNYSLKPLTPPPHHTVEADHVDYQDYSLVITGDVFRWMINHAPLETLQRVSASAADKENGEISLLFTTDAGQNPDIRADVS